MEFDGNFWCFEKLHVYTFDFSTLVLCWRGSSWSNPRWASSRRWKSVQIWEISWILTISRASIDLKSQPNVFLSIRECIPSVSERYMTVLSLHAAWNSHVNHRFSNSGQIVGNKTTAPFKGRARVLLAESPRNLKSNSQSDVPWAPNTPVHTR